VIIAVVLVVLVAGGVGGWAYKTGKCVSKDDTAKTGEGGTYESLI